MQILEDFIKNSPSSGYSDGVARHSLNISPISVKNVLCERLLGGLSDEMWCSAKLALDTVFFFFYTVVNFLTFHSKYIMLMLTPLLMAVRSCASRHKQEDIWKGLHARLTLGSWIRMHQLHKAAPALPKPIIAFVICPMKLWQFFPPLANSSVMELWFAIILSYHAQNTTKWRHLWKAMIVNHMQISAWLELINTETEHNDATANPIVSHFHGNWTFILS